MNFEVFFLKGGENRRRFFFLGGVMMLTQNLIFSFFLAKRALSPNPTLTPFCNQRRRKISSHNHARYARRPNGYPDFPKFRSAPVPNAKCPGPAPVNHPQARDPARPHYRRIASTIHLCNRSTPKASRLLVRTIQSRDRKGRYLPLDNTADATVVWRLLVSRLRRRDAAR